MLKEKHERFEVDAQKLLFAYFGKWWAILCCALGGILAALVITLNFITPMYQASVTVYVNNSRTEEQISYISNSNLVTAQRLVNTYINIIGSDTVLSKVAEATQLNVTAETIRSVMSANQVGNTELFKVFITHTDPKMAAQLANAVAKVAPGEIERFVEGSSTKIIDYAKVPGAPYSPNVTQNCMLGGVVGAALALAIITLRVLLDVRIKEEEDLTALFDIPVLGQIPDFVAANAKRHDVYSDNTVRDFKGDKKGARE